MVLGMQKRLFLGLFQLVANKDAIILDYTNNGRVSRNPMFVGQIKIGIRGFGDLIQNGCFNVRFMMRC